MADHNGSYMILNVGGICYKTSRLTLTSNPDSMLSAMFSEGGVPPQLDKNGHYFIDRDGAMFRYILNFMRNGKLCLPSNFEEYDQLLAETEFFQLSALKEEIFARSGDSYVTLNVGGVCYTTSRLTLTSYKDSMLGAMFSEGGVRPQSDKNGHYFIDRDGAMFRYILNFMRDGKLNLPSNFEEYDQLLVEAVFFQLPALQQRIATAMNFSEL